MAVYDSAWAVLVGSVEEGISGVIVDRAVDGTPFLRSLHPALKRRFLLKHYLTVAQYEAHRIFYRANRLLPVTFVWLDLVSYTAYFNGEPNYNHLGASIIEADVKLAQT